MDQSTLDDAAVVAANIHRAHIVVRDPLDALLDRVLSMGFDETVFRHAVHAWLAERGIEEMPF